MVDKWNVVYTKTVAGTVSQDKIDEWRKALQDPNVREGIWNIELNKDSPDEDIAKFLMLNHEVIEEEDIEMEIEEVGKI